MTKSKNNSMIVRVHDLAHARSGDKGNHSNIALFAYQPENYSILVEQLTEIFVANIFSSRQPTEVRRFLLPKLNGMNFLLKDILDGGVNESMNLDTHGKTLSFLLLSLELDVPKSTIVHDQKQHHRGR